MSLPPVAAAVARSLRIYHGPDAPKAAMDALYRRFVTAGDLVFDIGGADGGAQDHSERQRAIFGREAAPGIDGTGNGDGMRGIIGYRFDAGRLEPGEIRPPRRPA